MEITNRFDVFLNTSDASCVRLLIVLWLFLSFLEQKHFTAGRRVYLILLEKDILQPKVRLGIAGLS